MNRGSILLRLQQYLQENVPGQSIAEYLIVGVDNEHKSRSVFVTGTADQAACEHTAAIIQQLFPGNRPHYAVRAWFSADIANLMNNDLIPPSSNRLENNWRGRIMTVQQLNAAGDAVQLRGRVMQSIWRILVDQGPELDFFVRHDLFPVLWDAGFSIAGNPTFPQQIQSSIDTILFDRPTRKLDVEFDIIKCFAKGPGHNHFDPLGADITAAHLIQQPEETTADIIGRFAAYAGFAHPA